MHLKITFLVSLHRTFHCKGYTLLIGACSKKWCEMSVADKIGIF